MEKLKLRKTNLKPKPKPIKEIKQETLDNMIKENNYFTCIYK